VSLLKRANLAFIQLGSSGSSVIHALPNLATVLLLADLFGRAVALNRRSARPYVMEH
jgi:hypothetical protein